jgi:MscS family membrane protein
MSMKKMTQLMWTGIGMLGWPLAAWAQETAGATSKPAASRPSSTSFFDDLKFDELLEQNGVRQWSTLLAAILVAAALGRILTFILQRISRRMEKRGWTAQLHVFSGLTGPGNLALFTLGLSLGLAQLTLSPLLRGLSGRILLLLYTVSAFWYAFNLVSALEVVLRRLTARTETTLDDDLVPVIRKALRIFIVVIGALFILQNVFNRDIGAWLAGLGIAGLAVSLAAQDSLKNLFGSLTILFDRPFVVGQRIVFRDCDGTVEDIGFRSTRVRTAEGALVSIPNSLIVNESVNNWALRQNIRRVLDVTITCETPVAKVKQAVEMIKGLLESEEFRGPVHDPDPKVNADPPRVYFDEFNPDSLNIKVYYWYRPADWWSYMEYTERFNLRLMEELEKAGIERAYPTRSMIVKGSVPGR